MPDDKIDIRTVMKQAERDAKRKQREEERQAEKLRKEQEKKDPAKKEKKHKKSHKPKKYNFLLTSSFSKLFGKIKNFFANIVKNILHRNEEKTTTVDLDAEYGTNQTEGQKSLTPQQSAMEKVAGRLQRASYAEKLRMENAERTRHALDMYKKKTPHTPMLEEYLKYTLDKNLPDTEISSVANFITNSAMFKGKISSEELTSIFSHITGTKVLYDAKDELYSLVYETEEGKIGVFQFDKNLEIHIPGTYNGEDNLFAKKLPLDLYHSIDDMLISNIKHFKTIFADDAISYSNLNEIRNFVDKNKDELQGKSVEFLKMIENLESSSVSSKHYIAINRAFKEVLNDDSLSPLDKLKLGFSLPLNCVQNMSNPLNYQALHTINQSFTSLLSLSTEEQHLLSVKMLNALGEDDVFKLTQTKDLLPMVTHFASVLHNGFNIGVSDTHNLNFSNNEIIDIICNIASSDNNSFALNSALIIATIKGSIVEYATSHNNEVDMEELKKYVLENCLSLSKVSVQNYDAVFNDIKNLTYVVANGDHQNAGNSLSEYQLNAYVQYLTPDAMFSIYKELPSSEQQDILVEFANNKELNRQIDEARDPLSDIKLPDKPSMRQSSIDAVEVEVEEQNTDDGRSAF